MATENPSQLAAPFRRSEDFATKYSNNFQMESSVWDLKIIFGQLDQSNGQNVEQHTAITIPWVAAKLLAFYLEAQIASYEGDYGEIYVPSNVVPPIPDQLPDELADNQLANAIWEYVRAMHRRFFRVHHRMADLIQERKEAQEAADAESAEQSVSEPPSDTKPRQG